MQNRVLVTGSSGRVGSAIARHLASEYEIVGLDLVPGPHTTHIGSVTDRVLVRESMRDVTAVVHAAALHVPDLPHFSAEAFNAVNVRGTGELIDRALANGVRAFVYSSTTSVYGNAMTRADRAVWVSEDLAPEPRDIYDHTKLAAEGLCRAAANSGLSTTILRFARCFPEADRVLALYRLYRGVDVRDVAAAHAVALARSSQSGGAVFNISARTPFRPEDCEQLLHDPVTVLGVRCPDVERLFAERSWPLPTSIDRVYSIDKAEAGLGYRPRYNFREYMTGD